MPACVREATAAYRTEQDVLAVFIADRCDVGDVSCRADELYRCYRDWCAGARERAITRTAFGRRMTERGYRMERAASGKMRLGIQPCCA